MTHARARGLGLALAALLSLTAGLVGAASPAAASEAPIGWLRLDPAAGGTDTAIVSLTQAACPDGRAVVARLTGPGITVGKVGNLVGVTELKAFKPTMTDQMWVPFSFTFDTWFTANNVTRQVGKPYTISVVCRDLLRGSVTFGSFTGQVVFDAKGGYKALGEAAKPFNTELKPDDPLLGAGGGSAAPSPAATGAAPATSAPADPGATASASSTTQPEPSGTDAGSAAASTDAPVTTAQTPAASSDSGSVWRVLLIGLGLVALGLFAWPALRRRRGTVEPVGAREREPVDTH